jgi:hypothetical protein
MRIEVYEAFASGEYVRAKFLHENVTIESDLLDATDCITMAESLRKGADALEHYSRVIRNKCDTTDHFQGAADTTE